MEPENTLECNDEQAFVSSTESDVPLGPPATTFDLKTHTQIHKEGIQTPDDMEIKDAKHTTKMNAGVHTNNTKNSISAQLKDVLRKVQKMQETTAKNKKNLRSSRMAHRRTWNFLVENNLANAFFQSQELQQTGKQHTGTSSGPHNDDTSSVETPPSIIYNGCTLCHTNEVEWGLMSCGCIGWCTTCQLKALSEYKNSNFKCPWCRSIANKDDFKQFKFRINLLLP